MERVEAGRGQEREKKRENGGKRKEDWKEKEKEGK